MVWATHSSPDTAPPDKIARFLERCETSRRGAVLQIEHKLRGLRNSGSADAHEIARLENQLRLLQANQTPVVPELSFPPQVGAIGRMPGLACHTEQVLAADEAVVRCSFPVTVATMRNFKRYRERVMRPVDFVLRGASTSGLREGADQEMLGVFEVVGRERYETEAGRTKDVLVLREFDLKTVEPYFRRQPEGR